MNADQAKVCRAASQDTAAPAARALWSAGLQSRFGKGGDESPHSKAPLASPSQAGSVVRQSARTREFGFTLVEILVTVALIVLLFFLVLFPVLTGFAFMEKGIARADAQSAARLAMDAMSRELAEAMYVFDPPIGGLFVAFLPARSAPTDTEPIEPEALAIRYWRALRDPAYPYAPYYEEGADPVNPYYLARTEIEDPAKRDDDWNDSAGALTRATFWYPDDYNYPPGSEQSWPTAQPGYPWLEGVFQHGVGAAAYRFYRERAVGLTPDSADFDVPVAGFSPARITEESLVPWTSAFPRDYSRYRARYPLWADFAQWNPAAADPAEPYVMMGQIKVYAGSPRALRYQTGVDVATGEVWVVRVSDGQEIYNTRWYPARDVSDAGQREFAFGIDYDRGEVRFDFPAQEPAYISTGAVRYSFATLLPTVNAVANGVVIPGSMTLWVRDARSGETTYYRQVSDPANVGVEQFAIDDATDEVVFNSTDPPAAGLEIHVRYYYRNNRDDQLVVATYATKAIINIALTVSKRDIAARRPERQRQDVHLVARVKLKNVPR